MKIIVFTLLLITVCARADYGQGRQPAGQDGVVELLRNLGDVRSGSSSVGELFRTGDARIRDLVLALDNPDRKISLNAQLMIRYLGNSYGMKQLLEWYDKKNDVIIKGPIPLPLNDWDYNFIRRQYLNTTPSSWVNAEPYIYAVALDDTPRARAVLGEMTRKLGRPDPTTTAGRAMIQVSSGHPKRLINGKGDLANLTLGFSFFITPRDRKYAEARLLAFNGNGNKALVEIYINRGVLAEEWYHVVLTRKRLGWQFYSVTQVAVS